MDSLKKRIINKILNLLKLNNISSNEIKKIEKDLINNDFNSLIYIINNNYNDIVISKEIKQFVKSLVKSELIKESYLLKVNNISYIDIKDKLLLHNSRPLQLKNNYYREINNFKNLTNPQRINKSKEDYLREKIIESRTNYLNDPTGFITNLELMDAENIYQTFTNSHDITLIQHCISKLSIETLNKLLIFVEDKIKINHYDVMSIFIEEAIKRNIHNKKIA